MSDSIEIDWTNCPDIERVAGKVSGQPIVKGTRILATCVTENMDDATPEELDDLFPGLGVQRVRRIIDYARRYARQPHPAR